MTQSFIYHICGSAEWAAAEAVGFYGGSTADQADGFIHFSTAAQLRESALKHHAGQRDRILLTVATAPLSDALKWETSRGGQLFPHLYGALATSTVDHVQPLPLAGDGQPMFPLLADEPAGAIAVLPGIAAIAERYQGFILDLWGVLHDGSAPLPGVLDCLERLQAAGKRVVILSNAPRRAHLVEARVSEIGIARHLYQHLMSSGEEAWQHLSRRDDPFYRALGRVCYHIGPPRDDNMLADLGLTRVDDAAQAEFILNTGPWGWEETVASYETLLQTARARGLPMVCANPDLVVVHSGRRAICAGALAERYEAMGGRVRWHGKPMPAVYETCFSLLEIADHRRILAVGDSLRTDIAGANAVGIDSVWILGGIHGEELGAAAGILPDSRQLSRAIADSGKRPTWAMAHLRW